MKKVFFIICLFFSFVLLVNASVEVSSFDDLKNAIDSGQNDIKLVSDFAVTDKIVINGSVKIDGNNKKMERSSEYLYRVFDIKTGASLELLNITIDGNAPDWKLDFDNTYYSGGYVRFPTINYDNDLVAEESLIANAGSLKLKKVNVQNIISKTDGSFSKGVGNVQIDNCNFIHIGSYRQGAVFHISGGTTTITNSIFKDNATGVISKESTRGGAIFSTKLVGFSVDNVQFINNLAQTDGGALFIETHPNEIKNSVFKDNKVGNDGAAITLNNGDNLNTLVENTTFDGNIGYADGQSLGTIYHREWHTTKDNPTTFKKCIFKNNKTSAGGIIADMGSGHPYVVFEDSEFYGNYAKSGGVIYGQGNVYYIKNSIIHDNSAKNGAVIMSYVNSYTYFQNTKISNNTASNRGGVLYLCHGTVSFEDSILMGNKSEGPGGALYVDNYNFTSRQALRVKDSTVTDNSGTYGGGIALYDYNDNGFNVLLENSKIYNNHADTAGDDIAYRINSNNNEGNFIVTINDAAKMGIPPIDGWYHDKASARYLDVEKPEKFVDFGEYSGTSIYLKAGGIGTLDYDLLGGKNDSIKPLTLKFGIPYIVDENVPIKDGYNFKEWNTKEDGSGRSLYAGDAYDGSEGLVLYAQYTSNEEAKEDDSVKTTPQRQEEKENPNTIDSIWIVIISSIVSFITIIVLPLWYNNRNRINNIK